MGMAFAESGAMNELRMPVSENGKGPWSWRQIHPRSALIPVGMFDSGQTMESSAGVRVMELNSP